MSLFPVCRHGRYTNEGVAALFSFSFSERFLLRPARSRRFRLPTPLLPRRRSSTRCRPRPNSRLRSEFRFQTSLLALCSRCLSGPQRSRLDQRLHLAGNERILRLVLHSVLGPAGQHSDRVHGVVPALEQSVFPAGLFRRPGKLILVQGPLSGVVVKK